MSTVYSLAEIREFIAEGKLVKAATDAPPLDDLIARFTDYHAAKFTVDLTDDAIIVSGIQFVTPDHEEALDFQRQWDTHIKTFSYLIETDSYLIEMSWDDPQ